LWEANLVDRSLKQAREFGKDFQPTDDCFPVLVPLDLYSNVIILGCQARQTYAVCCCSKLLSKSITHGDASGLINANTAAKLADVCKGLATMAGMAPFRSTKALSHSMQSQTKHSIITTPSLLLNIPNCACI
jgi:hypothetical protein